ncbi:hypothetical protein BCR44DRAFT_1500751 [Catenaria anguillulae PL171]|uniref:CYRIA/CYRIB Rac1 binding domain-containing protein n=1 Tax=Catenaria anguillulae PL171 TaxID=765915 RepID=A0A1Y2HK34_9FUNG|nr:hypothetical protein BCR44DRAFT_1500751 [Catenaria anguillulae PL171]
MGQLLALLRPSSEPALPPVASVNLLDPVVSEAEQQLLNSVKAILTKSPAILSLLKQYQGCDEQIRAAISQPNPQNDSAAWDAVVPCVIKLRECYEYATQVEQLLPAILATFCATGPDGSVNVQSNLETHQATAKAFADFLSFSWEFDELKMSKPAIQNDFSYYRRTVSRTKNAGGQQSQLPVTEEVSGKMSLFFAYPSPFLKMMTDSSSVSALFALRTMTGCLIMYDFIHPVGLFPKASEVNIRMFIKTIQSHGGSASNTLLNNLRYATKTYSSPDVPKTTKALLETPGAA